MDRLAAMAAFRAVVEEQGFGKAADHLSLSPASVSRMVAYLEHHLSTRLLHRTTRSLRPTDEGRLYYERCVRILDEVEETERRLREAHDVPRGILRITVAPAIGFAAIVPLLPSFCAKYPEVRVDLNIEPRMVDLVREGFDLALRIRETEWRNSTLIARHLANFGNRFVASPSYLQARGWPTHLGDLAHHQVILESRWTPTPAAVTFDGPDGRHEVRIDGPVSTDSSTAQRTLALAGMGIAELPDYLVADDLRSGALIELFSHHRVAPIELWAVYPAQSTLAARVRAFVEHVIAALQLPEASK